MPDAAGLSTLFVHASRSDDLWHALCIVFRNNVAFPRESETRAMPNEFTVVGEDRDDDSHLLVVGADGKYYDYAAAHDHLSPVEPDERWIVQQRSDDLFVESAEWGRTSS